MNGKRLFTFALCLLLLLSTLSPIAATAGIERGIYDAGGFAGDSDWGGSSDSDWGSSSDSDWDSDGGGGDFSPFTLIILVIFVVIYFAAKSKGQNATPAQPANANIDKLTAKDPAFSAPKFLENVGNMYVQLQNAWQAKDFEPMRALMTDGLYNQFTRQLAPFIQNKQTNHVDRITVLSTNIIGYRTDDQYDILTVRLQTRIVDYVTDDQTGQILRGSNTKELFMTYDWTLTRAKDMQTLSGDTMSHVNCPNCGAPLEVKQSAKCEYCDTVVSLTGHDWTISGIKGVSQRS